jgi:ATP-dependent Clp protease protease subunit
MFKVNADSGEMFIYEEIGPAYWGFVDAATVIAALEDIGDRRATVRLNSPGGSVDEGVAIYNALVRHSGGVDIAIDSLAASAASFIAMAGDNITIAKNARMMIHSPWTIALGNATDLRKTADVLDKYDESLVASYAERSGNSEDDVRALMAAETWYTATEAVEAGFADQVGNLVVEDQATVAANRYKNTPAAFIIPDKKVAAKAGTKTQSNWKLQDAELRLRLARAK